MNKKYIKKCQKLIYKKQNFQLNKNKKNKF